MIADAVTGAFGLVPSGETGAAYDALSDLLSAGSGFLGFSGDPNLPKAYLNYHYFDTDHNYLTSGFVQVREAADGNFEELALQLIADQPGYVYLYVANETQASFNVFFDDLEVNHIYTPIVQKDDYYPFGGTFNSYTSGVKNQYLFNSKELQNETGWYDYGARMYDPWGKPGFLQIDPAAEMFFSHSPYSYSFNNPVNFVDKDGMVPEQAGSTDPTKLYGKQIDMSNAPGSVTNAAGFPRNGPWFWRQMLENHPEMFSADNIREIKSGRAPIIDDQWIKHNSTHTEYKGGKLVHHHIDQGKMTTGIPEAAHQKMSGKLHPKRGLGSKGLGLLGVAAFAMDIYNSFTGDPHSIGMLYRAGKELNTLYFDTDTEQYFEVTSRSDLKDSDGNVIGQEVTYDTYGSYQYNEDTGKYEGVNKTGTYKATRYTGEDAKRVFQELIKGG